VNSPQLGRFQLGFTTIYRNKKPRAIRLDLAGLCFSGLF